MRPKTHNISSKFGPKKTSFWDAIFSETGQNKRKQQHQVLTLKVHVWLGRVGIATKQEIKKTL